eukprot:CAMPEP_0183350880 /NCGR_PEP_ID=MMETSP0164_2-20130417/21627_1 /TAXON_ID=221442 /ORGANISM="Coccolithus pelagicus ssp braarudi, Strain PLY182g" /LENGTH=185 /DNA_ID=CAMNT_0025522899 /DNA_START=18 /DNA_END=575 /DNA_ORIENTATION=+
MASSMCSAKDIERFMKEREERKTTGHVIPMPQDTRRSFSAMEPDFAALQKFEAKVEKKLARNEVNQNKVETEAVINVMGSTAGAGSGDFHTYRGFRAKEMMRIKDMEDERKEEAANEAWEKERQEREAAILAKSSKRAAKRERQKAKEREAKEQKRAASGGAASGAAASSSSEQPPTVEKVAADG